MIKHSRRELEDARQEGYAQGIDVRELLRLQQSRTEIEFKFVSPYKEILLDGKTLKKMDRETLRMLPAVQSKQREAKTGLARYRAKLKAQIWGTAAPAQPQGGRYLTVRYKPVLLALANSECQNSRSPVSNLRTYHH